jgi:hypothetical protein
MHGWFAKHSMTTKWRFGSIAIHPVWVWQQQKQHQQQQQWDKDQQEASAHPTEHPL